MPHPSVLNPCLLARARGLPRRAAALLGILLLALCGLLGSARAADDFLEPERAFADTAAMADPLTLDIHWEIAPGYYMYQDRFEVRIEDAQGRLLVFRRSDLTPEDAETRAPAWGDALRLPHGQVKYDPTFEKDMEVFHGGVTLRAALRPGAEGPLQVAVTGQGCADEGLCYPPMTKTFVLQADGGGYRAVGEQVRDRVPPPRDEDQLKALGAAAASTGSVALFHAVGITPEAPTVAEAFGGKAPEEMVEIRPDDVARALQRLSRVSDGAPISAVCLGTPHFSRAEWDRLLSLLRGSAQAGKVPVYVNTGRETLGRLERDGVLNDVAGFDLIPVADACT